MAFKDSKLDSKLLFSSGIISGIDSDAWEITNDPTMPFSVAVITNNCDISKTLKTLANIGKLHCPIIGTETKNPRFDAVYDPSINNSLNDAIKKLNPLIDSYLKIKNLSDSTDKNYLQILATIYLREVMINAKWAPEKKESIDYPLLNGLENPRALLEDLANSNLLGRVFFDKIHNCGQCGSNRQNVREECNKCTSSNIQKEPLVHHYKCGHQAAERLFFNDRKLICPKCKAELRHYGVDYDKPGEIYSCNDCSHQSSEPNVGFICMDCEFKTPSESMNTIDWYHYQLTQDGIDAVKTGLLPYRSLQSAIMGIAGAYNTRDFYQLAKFICETSTRYKRPITSLSLELNNIQDLRKLLSTQKINETMRLIAEIISQNLRNTDITTSSNSFVSIVLPETSAEQTNIVTTRIKNQLKEKISIPLDVEINIYSGEKAIDIIKMAE